MSSKCRLQYWSHHDTVQKEKGPWRNKWIDVWILQDVGVARRAMGDWWYGSLRLADWLTVVPRTGHRPTDRMDGFGKILVHSFGSTQENILEAKTFLLQNRNMLVVVELTNKVNCFWFIWICCFSMFHGHLARYTRISFHLYSRMSQCFMFLKFASVAARQPSWMKSLTRLQGFGLIRHFMSDDLSHVHFVNQKVYFQVRVLFQK